MQINSESISLALQMLTMIIGGTLAAFWIGLVIWTVQDIRTRSRESLIIVLSVLLVLVFNLLGLVFYLLLRPKETLAQAYERKLEEETLLQGLKNRGECPNCQRSVKHDFVLCPACHTPLKRTCQRCNQLLQLDWGICPYCAEPVSIPIEPAAQVSSQISYSRPKDNPL
jgi:hypothetical protein